MMNRYRVSALWLYVSDGTMLFKASLRGPKAERGVGHLGRALKGLIRVMSYALGLPLHMAK